MLLWAVQLLYANSIKQYSHLAKQYKANSQMQGALACYC